MTYSFIGYNRKTRKEAKRRSLYLLERIKTRRRANEYGLCTNFRQDYSFWSDRIFDYVRRCSCTIFLDALAEVRPNAYDYPIEGNMEKYDANFSKWEGEYLKARIELIDDIKDWIKEHV